MKRFALLIPLLLLAACGRKEEAYVPGEPDKEGCYYVYFPAQNALTGAELLITPDKERYVDVAVARKVAGEGIEVPYVLTSDIDESVFDRGTIVFAPGQSETTVRIGFGGAPAYQSVRVNLEVSDPQYAGLYESEAQSLSFSFLLVELVNMGKATFTQRWWGDFYFGDPALEIRADVLYYELDGIRYCHTENEECAHGYPGFWGFGNEPELNGNHFEWLWYPDERNVDGFQPVEIPIQRIAFEDWSEWGYGVCNYNIFDRYHYWQDFRKSSDYGSFLNFMSRYKNTYPLSYFDGEGGFHFLIYAYILPEYTAYSDAGYSYFTNLDEDVTGVLDHYEAL